MARYSKTIVKSIRVKQRCRGTSFSKIFFASAAGTFAVGAWMLIWNRQRALKGEAAIPAMLPVRPIPQNLPSVQLQPGQPKPLPKFPALTVEV
jgi:hypothetical protein